MKSLQEQIQYIAMMLELTVTPLTKSVKTLAKTIKSKGGKFSPVKELRRELRLGTKVGTDKVGNIVLSGKINKGIRPSVITNPVTGKTTGIDASGKRVNHILGSLKKRI